MKKIESFFFAFLLFAFAGVQKAQAVCPVCVVAVSGGIELSRWLGVDDSVTGLWIGGLTVSMISWTIEYLKNKKIDFLFRTPVVIFSYFTLVFLSLYYSKLMSNPINTICSCATDKIFVGFVVGSFGLWSGAVWYEFLKEKNGGHAHFPFQKVVMPVAPLILMSIIFYVLTK